jgi:hypothetical protein
MIKFAELIIRVKAAPMTLYQVKKSKDEKKRGISKDVDVSTVYEHGWIDSDTFRWFVPDGRYWVIQGIPGENHICSISVKGGKCEYKQMKEFDLQKWRDEQSEMRKDNIA